MMAVLQQNKDGNIRPVMDYSRELNQHISSNPSGDVAICQNKLRDWRKLGSNSCLLDLKKAYLQLFVDEELLKFQAVRFKGKFVCNDPNGLWAKCSAKNHVQSLVESSLVRS